LNGKCSATPCMTGAVGGRWSIADFGRLEGNDR
jgi:hypothetical protein